MTGILDPDISSGNNNHALGEDFGKKASSEDVINGVHLWELNKFFNKSGLCKSNELLGAFEKEMEYVLYEYRHNLKKFIQVIKEELMKGDRCFDLDIKPEDTIQIMKAKFKDNENKISSFIQLEGLKYVLNKRVSNRMKGVFIEMQLNDMIFIAFHYIQGDEEFLFSLLKRKKLEW